MVKLKWIKAVVLLSCPKEDSVFIPTFGHMVYWFGKSFLGDFNPFKEHMNFMAQTDEYIEKIIDQFLLIIQVTTLILIS